MDKETIKKKVSPTSVATKMIYLVVFLSGVIAFTFSAVQLSVSFKKDKSLIEASLDRIEQEYVADLAQALFENDQKQINFLVESISKKRNIHFMRIELLDSRLITFGSNNFEEKITKVFPLIFETRNKKSMVGKIIVQSDLSKFYDKFSKKIMFVILVNLLKMIAIAGTLLLVMNFYVTKPLKNLMRYCQNISNQSFTEKFEFKDEFLKVSQMMGIMFEDLNDNYQDIKKSEERFKDISQFKNRVVWETDLNMTITYISDFVSSDKVDTYLLDAHPWNKCKETLLQKFLILKSLQSFRDLEFHFSESSSEIIWSISAKPFFDDKARHIGYRFISEDITQSKQLQMKLEVQKEQIRQNQKMDALGQITGGLTHDFNNLLMIIQGSLRNITKSIERGRDFNKYLITANNAVDRGRKLTKKLLVYSRKEALTPTRQNVNDLVMEMSDILEKCLNEKITLKVDLCQNVKDIFIDPMELENACINMAINSRDAMPHGGKITIETNRVSIQSANDLLDRGEYVQLSFTDSGRGIPSHVINKVFEPFFTTKDIGQGTGLGLSQIYGFVKDSKGKIDIKSRINEGTQINMFFPVLAEIGLHNVPTI
ncbi:hypothetical protein A9Q84_01935 [Halobacteriovorax marinus]|uniref:histidine kinase n=1 Tax=Halobacteriovorax marinus TaxID=97084 RepID=A0A1Y5FC76_9BACT|nr:hypothetical protein A9Q84_01935 [Halobacteriovorax marinus]